MPAYSLTVRVMDDPTAGFMFEAVSVVVVGVAATTEGVVAVAVGVLVATAVVAASAAGVVVAAAVAVVAAREVNTEIVKIKAIKMAVDFTRLFMVFYLFSTVTLFPTVVRL